MDAVSSKPDAESTWMHVLVAFDGLHYYAGHQNGIMTTITIWISRRPMAAYEFLLTPIGAWTMKATNPVNLF